MTEAEKQLIDSIKQQGGSKEEALKALNDFRAFKSQQTAEPETDDKQGGVVGAIKGFGQDVKESFKATQEKGADIRERAARGEQSKLSTGLQTAGGVAGFFADTLFSGVKAGVKAVTPDFVEEGVVNSVKKNFERFSQTDTGKSALEALGKGVDAWEKFSEEKPVAAANIGAAVSVADAVTMFAGVGTGSKLAQKGGTKIATKADDVLSGFKLSKSKVDDIISKRFDNKHLDNVNDYLDYGQYMTKSQARKAAIAGEIDPARTFKERLFSGDKIKLTESRKQYIRDIAPFIDKNIDVLDNIANIQKMGRELTNVADKVILKNNKEHFVDDIIKNITKAVDEKVAKYGQSSAQQEVGNVINRMKEQIERFSDNGQITTLGLQRARRELDNTFRGASGGIDLLDQSGQAKADALRAVRDFANKTTNKDVGGDAIKSILKRQSNSFKAADELVTQYTHRASYAKRAFNKIVKSPITAATGAGIVGGIMMGSTPIIISALALGGLTGQSIKIGKKVISTKAMKKFVKESLENIDAGKFDLSKNEIDAVKGLGDVLEKVSPPTAKNTIVIPEHTVRKVSESENIDELLKKVMEINPNLVN